MSIYATMWQIQVEDEQRGGSWEDAWIEVYCQGVPNHINEENGYTGPIWEWLPKTVHKRNCERRAYTYYVKPTDHPMIVEHCDESDSESMRRVSYDCDCGLRAVFICDDLTTKGTERNGQEYVNPVLVMTGAEYRRITWEDMLERISDALAKRQEPVRCLEPGCDERSVHTSIRNRKVHEAWCQEHDVPKLWRGQRRRRKAAGREDTSDAE